MRIDKWLIYNFNLTVPQVQSMLREKKVAIQCPGETPLFDVLRLSQKVLHDHIVFLEGEELQKRIREERTETEQELKIRDWVVYKDDEYIAVDKPYGVATQGEEGSLARLKYGLKFEKSDGPRIVHRIDKLTSGIVILARTRDSAVHLSKAFAEKAIEKEYIALLDGIPAQKKGVIEVHVSKERKHKIKLLEDDHEDGISALTRYRIIQTKGNYSIALLFPGTGRMHQLRVHCKSIGAPIHGDMKYNPKSTAQKLHLHARSIKFNNQNDNEVYIKAPLPLDFVDTLINLQLIENPSDLDKIYFH